MVQVSRTYLSYMSAEGNYSCSHTVAATVYSVCTLYIQCLIIHSYIYTYIHTYIYIYIHIYIYIYTYIKVVTVIHYKTMTSIHLNPTDCVWSWLSGNLGKISLRLILIVDMYFDTSKCPLRED